MNTKSIAESWIQLQKLSNEPDKAEDFFWAAEELSLLTDSDPKKCWEIIMEVLSLSEDEWVLTNLAAGPLEEMLALSPSETIIFLENEIPKNSKLKKILSGVWKNLIPDDVWERLQVLSK